MSKVISNRRQLNRLAELMKKNESLAQNLLAKPLAQQKWKEITAELNKLGPPKRESDKWKRVWTDLKFKANKRRYRRVLNDSADECTEPKVLKHVKEEVVDSADDSNISADNENDQLLGSIKFEEITEPSEYNSRGDKDNDDGRSMDGHFSAENEFYEHMKDVLNDVKTSLREMEDYTRKSFYLKKDHYDKVLRIKKEKLALYKRHLKMQESKFK